MIGFLEGFLALVIGKKQSKGNCSQSLLNTDIANLGDRFGSLILHIILTSWTGT